MTRPHACLRCQGGMTEGFVPTERSGVRALNQWHEGAPRKGWMQVKAGTRMIDVRTFRCQRCGYLESYASDDDRRA